MTRILIVKTSSLGDIVHALPVLDDIRRAQPGAVIDWVAEETFAELPALHPAVSGVIPVAIRRWRRRLFASATAGEVQRFLWNLRAQTYDHVLDLQGLVKSAWVATRAAGPTSGYDARSIREPLAALAYRRRFRIARTLHAIERNRELAAAALGYSVSGPPTAGLSLAAAVDVPPEPFVVFLHATSATGKLWPEADWEAAVDRLTQAGVAVVLPWGSDVEHARSRRLARGRSRARIPARLALSQLAALFARAEAVVGVDTGLVHLAAVAGAPVVGLYSDSDPGLTGVVGFGAPAINLGRKGAPAPREAVFEALAQVIRSAPRC